MRNTEQKIVDWILTKWLRLQLYFSSQPKSVINGQWKEWHESLKKKTARRIK